MSEEALKRSLSRLRFVPWDPQRWLKMLQFKDSAGRGAFSCDDFVDLAGKLYPGLRPEILALAHAAACGGGGEAKLEPLAMTLAYLEASTLQTRAASA